MGLFERIFGKVKQPARIQGDYKLLTGYQPTFSSFSGNIYSNETVRACIDCNATHISRLNVEFEGRGANILAKRLKQPNQFETWSQFMQRTATIFYATNNAIIVPVLDNYNRVKEIYPVLPSRCKVVQVEGAPWLAFEFSEGHFAQVPVWRCAMLRRFPYLNDVFGEDNRALTPTMELVTIQQEGITEAVKSTATYRFMAQMDNLTLPEDLEKYRSDFVEKNFTPGRKGGLILFPSSFKGIQQVSQKPYVVDVDQQKLIDNRMYNYFGVNEDLLQNRCYGDKYIAYYNSEIEPFAIQFSEVMTIMMLLNGELTGEDAAVKATANRMEYMSSSEKLSISTSMTDRGILNRDEVRALWSLPPLPDGEGQRYIIRGEYWDAETKLNEANESGLNEGNTDE